jgi:GH24 family phage-related lysozyme (muramidase)
MQRVTASGVELIKRFEGKRLTAYRDAVGVWTIGYGHTAMAGAPDVKAGMLITEAEAATILSRDVNMFAVQVQRMITQPIGDSQFSALVSFAYNVGLGNFAGSSVLKAVNAGQFDAVGRRLALWNKAGGRVLAGLTRRRAAEALLFQQAGGGAMSLFDLNMPLPSESELNEMIMLRGQIDPPEAPALGGSREIWGAICQFGAFVATLVSAISDEVRKAMWQAQEYYFLVPGKYWTAFIALFIGCALLTYVIRRRWKRAQEDGV